MNHHDKSLHRFSHGRRVGIHWRKYSGGLWIVSLKWQHYPKSYHHKDYGFLSDYDDYEEDIMENEVLKPISCVKVSNVNQAGKAEGEGIIVYPDKVTLLAAWFEDGKMVST